MTEKNPTRVVVGPVRLSYCHLWEPYVDPESDEKPKYSCTIIIPKEDTDTIAKIKAAQKAALEIGKTKKFGGIVPKKLSLTLHDGDGEDVDEEKYPELPGNMFMAIRSFDKPGIIDRAKNQITDESKVYSGVWAYVSMNAYAYDYRGKKGISFGLNHIMLANTPKGKSDENLTGRTSADEDFADFDADEDVDADDIL